MAKTATIHVRIDEQVKKEALEIFDVLGISASDAVTMFFRQTALKKGIPFELTATSKPRNNFEKVNKLKQEDLKRILDALPDSVDELWVFGSALTPYCKPESDIDVCVVGDNITNEDCRTLMHAPTSAMDLIDASHEVFENERKVVGSIYNEVQEKGLLIYDKAEGLV